MPDPRGGRGRRRSDDLGRQAHGHARLELQQSVEQPHEAEGDAEEAAAGRLGQWRGRRRVENGLAAGHGPAVLHGPELVPGDEQDGHHDQHDDPLGGQLVVELGDDGRVAGSRRASPFRSSASSPVRGIRATLPP